MGCVLNVVGVEFRPTDFTASSGLVVTRTWTKGEKRIGPTVDTHAESGLSITVSDAAMSDFDQQVLDAIAFLEREDRELKQLLSCDGVDYAGLDFAVAMRFDLVSRTTKLPPALVSLASKFGLGIDLSQYVVS
jgi:hypothetical protein